MATLIISIIVFIISISVSAIFLDNVQKHLQRQIDKLRKENRELKNRVFELDNRRFK